MHGALEGRPATGRAATVGDDHGEPLVGEPLARQERAPGVDHALGVRSAVRVEQHREAVPAGDVVARQQHRRRQAPLPRREQVHPRLEVRRLGERPQRRRGPRPRHPGDRPVVVEGGLRDDEHPAGQPSRRHAPLRAHRAHPGLAGPDVQHRRRRRTGAGRGEQDGVAVDVGHPADLQFGARHRLAVDDEAARVVGVRAPDQPAVVEVCGHTRDQVDPGVVDLGAHLARRPRRRVDLPQRDPLLVPRRRRDQECVPVPADLGEVLVVAEVDVGARAVEAEQVQRHRRVGRPGGRVGDDAGLAVGVGGIGDVPAEHGGVVDAGRRERGTVGSPPEPAVAVHLLRGDEVGEPPGDVLGVGRRERRRLPRPERVHVQRPTAHEGDAGSRRVRARVDDGALHRQGGRGRARGEPDGERPPGEHEGGGGDVAVGRVLHDAAGLLADPLPAGLLLGREVLLARDVEGERVDEQVLLAGRDVEHPQAGHRVVPATAAQEDDPGTVGSDRHAPRGAEGEAPRRGLATGERVGSGGHGVVDGHGRPSCPPSRVVTARRPGGPSHRR